MSILDRVDCTCLIVWTVYNLRYSGFPFLGNKIMLFSKVDVKKCFID